MNGWEKAGKDDSEAVYGFLLDREYSCVTLTSRLKEAGFPETAPGKSQGIMKIRRDPDNISAVKDVIFEGQYGLVIPVLGSEAKDSTESRPDIDALYERETPFLFSVIGLKRDVRVLEHAFERKPVKVINYFLMTAEEKTPAAYPVPSIYPGIGLRTAEPRDAQALFPLQKEYEKEEVLIDPSRFDGDACMSQLRETIRNGIVVFAELDGKPVAKAGTNALGYSWAQIGGVFTEKRMRNRHIGHVLMRYLLERLTGEGYRSCLFVKYENSPAVSLYRRLGFTIRDDFRISYYS